MNYLILTLALVFSFATIAPAAHAMNLKKDRITQSEESCPCGQDEDGECLPCDTIEE